MDYISNRLREDSELAVDTKRFRKSYRTARNVASLIYVDITPSTKPKQPTSLPSVLYTNCISLIQWTIEELFLYADEHKPYIICLTET